jgi:hypothetical protein
MPLACREVVRRPVMDRFIPKGDLDMGGSSIFDRPELRHLWDRARVSFSKNRKNPKKTFALEVRSEEAKVLYARVLALQSLLDGRLDPREIEYLYVFMSRVSMSSDSREEVRQTLATREAAARAHFGERPEGHRPRREDREVRESPDRRKG